MVVLKNGLLLHGVFYTVFDLVRGLLRLEVYQTAGVLPVFEDMNDGVRRPFALIAGVVAAGAACPAVFQRPRRGDLLLGQHTGYLGRTVPSILFSMEHCRRIIYQKELEMDGYVQSAFLLW